MPEEELFKRQFNPEKPPYMSEDYIINHLLGDTIGEMMQELKRYKEAKKPGPNNAAFIRRKELVEKLLTAYDYCHLRKHWDHIELRRRIKEFDKLMKEDILVDGQMPKELMRKQLLKFGDIYSLIEDINADSEVLAKRYKIEI